MKQKLQQIADHLERINRDLHRESEVWDAELRDRQAKHLEGEAAIKHYNEWMKAAGKQSTHYFTIPDSELKSLSINRHHSKV